MYGIAQGNNIIISHNEGCYIYKIEHFYKSIFPHKKEYCFLPTESGWDHIKSIQKKKLPCNKITFKDGVQILCSKNQPFLNPGKTIKKISLKKQLTKKYAQGKTSIHVPYLNHKYDFDKSALIGILDCDEVSINPRHNGGQYKCTLKTFFPDKIKYAKEKLNNLKIPYEATETEKEHTLEWYVNLKYVWDQYSHLNHHGYLEGVINIAGDGWQYKKKDNFIIKIKTKKAKVIQRCYLAFLTLKLKTTIHTYDSWYGRSFELWIHGTDQVEFLNQITLRDDNKERLNIPSGVYNCANEWKTTSIDNVVDVGERFVYEIKLDNMKTFLAGRVGFLSIMSTD